MKYLSSFMLFFLAFVFNQVIFAVPFNGNYPLAPNATAAEARQMVIEAGKKYEGIPYVHAGITAEGLDCSGFIYLSFHDALGVTLPRSASGLHSWADVISFDDAQPGDLLFFRTGNTTAITHVGLYLGDRRFVHAASAGSKTGVIYSNLDEQYYVNTYASAGRILPSASSNSITESGRRRNAGKGHTSSSKTRLLLGAAFAANWDFYKLSGNVLRGFTTQICFVAEFGPMLSFGLELRPEYDDALNVFRLPLTLSWGPTNEIFRIFAGPVLSFGNASFVFKGDRMFYSGGSSWLGSVGITLTPFIFNISNNEFTPYIEAAWQLYINNKPKTHMAADALACTRFSTGFRWRISLRRA